ncbi:DegQ family serine endoprotease [bacterium]|nr:DegQ family serine endoprotease [bacterium]
MSKCLRLIFLSLFLIAIEFASGDCYAQNEEESEPSQAFSLQNTFADVAEKVKPAVVQITTEKITTHTSRYWNPFEDFFRSPSDDFFGRRQQQRQPQKQYKHKQQGLGSGFIFRDDGYILTNNHVIKDVDSIKVKLPKIDKEYKAELVGSDSKTDIAIIKIITDKKLISLKLGDSEKIRVGEWAIAVGNPFGLEQTVTIGVVSAKGRHGFGITQYEDFIQTDASINQGNSGGPLLNIKGEVIGINTFILAPSMSQGIGFAIPINMAKDITSQLIKKGKVTRGWLGVIIQPVTDEIMDAFDLSTRNGALISDFTSDDSPAKKAGIKQGDVIVEFDGKKIKDSSDLQRIVAHTEIGRKIPITVIRGGKEKDLHIIIEEMPEELGEASIVSQPEESWVGLDVQNISEDIASRLGIKDTEGVIVTDVSPEGAAVGAGIKIGDIIREINGQKIRNLGDYNTAVNSIKDKSSAVFLVRRDKYSTYVIVKR